MISLEHRSLSIHIPKTGGNSVQNIQLERAEEFVHLAHDLQDDVKRFVVSDAFDFLYKLAALISPQERCASSHFSPHHDRSEWEHCATYCTPRTRQLVAKKFAEEIEWGGYTFEG